MKSIYFVFAGLAFVMLACSCSKEGEAIVQPNIGYLKFTTYTVDTFRFKISVNGILLTDSLRSPVSTETRQVSFIDSMATLRIENMSTGGVYLDSIIKLKPLQTTISIVQFASGQIPFLPSPPNDIPPVAGNYKVRFKFIQPENSADPFYDSIKCIIRLSSSPVDTIVLRKYEETPYYEATIGSNYSMKIVNAVTGATIDANTNNLNSNSFTDFNTAIIYAQSASNYLLKRIY